MEKHRIAVIGAGRAGSALAAALAQAGFTVSAVASRRRETAAALAQRLQAADCETIAAAAVQGDIVLLAVPDRQIGSVAEEIAAAGGFRSGQCVLHVSGAASLAVLEPARLAKASVGSMHPLQSLTGKAVPAGTYFAVSGQGMARTAAENLVKGMNGHSFYIDEEKRPLYHAGACIASNYLVALLDWAAAIYTGFGLTPQQAAAALLPLVEGTLQNIQERGTTAALTGPISRGDDTTVAAHLAALPALQRGLYQALGGSTLQIAWRQGDLTAEQYERMQKVLENGQKGDKPIC